MPDHLHDLNQSVPYQDICKSVPQVSYTFCMFWESLLNHNSETLILVTQGEPDCVVLWCIKMPQICVRSSLMDEPQVPTKTDCVHGIGKLQKQCTNSIKLVLLLGFLNTGLHLDQSTFKLHICTHAIISPGSI